MFYVFENRAGRGLEATVQIGLLFDVVVDDVDFPLLQRMKRREEAPSRDVENEKDGDLTITEDFFVRVQRRRRGGGREP